jgi:lysophospholipase L1-like esterase
MFMKSNGVSALSFIFSFLFFVATGVVSAQGSPRSPLDNHRVFVFGDSQVAGAFGNALTNEMVAAGATYYTRAGQVGWGVKRWLDHTSEITRLMNRHRPTLVLIALGGNDAGRSARESYPGIVARLWDHVNDQMETLHENTDVNWRVMWIGPSRSVGPASDIQPGRERAGGVIHNVVGEENYVNSFDLTGEYGRTSDGVHFTPEGGADWARRIMPRIISMM